MIAENEALEERLSRWQEDPAPSSAEIRDGQREYHDWYARAQKYVPAQDQDVFRDMYEGGQVIKRISAFLLAPRELVFWYDPNNENPAFSKWVSVFSDACIPALMKQRQILAQALHDGSDVDLILNELCSVFGRLPEYIATINNASNLNIKPPNIQKEKDLQVLVGAILQLLYRNVLAEDFVPKKSGASSRADFVIKDEGILVETKMTRKSLTDKRVGDELLIDWGRYPRYPEVRGVFALIYDPHRHLRNPAALEDDLSERSTVISMRAIVVH